MQREKHFHRFTIYQKTNEGTKRPENKTVIDEERERFYSNKSLTAKEINATILNILSRVIDAFEVNMRVNECKREGQPWRW